MKKLFLIASLLISSIIIFGQEMVSLQVENSQHPSVFQEVYDSIEGVWNTPSEGDMDIILNVDTTGAFTISIIPAFEFTNMTIIEQEQIIQDSVVENGYFKVIHTINQNLQSNSISANVEILLNGELSTNNLEITFDKVFILNTNKNIDTNDISNNNPRDLFLLR